MLYQNWMPRMPNTKNTTKHNRITWLSGRRDLSMAPTMTPIPGIRDMVRSGRSTRTVLIALKLSTPGIRLTHDISTTIKSSQFQPLRRYAPGCRANPEATILTIASHVKAIVKMISTPSANSRVSKLP